MRSSERSIRVRAEVAGAWTDPMLGVEYSNVPVSSLGLPDHPMAGLQLKAQQVIRPPGWSRLQREAGALRADAQGFAIQEAENQLRAAVANTWWMLARTRLLKAITEEHLARVVELQGAAQARYATGTIGQHALLRLEVLRDQLRDDLGDFDRAEIELTAALDESLGRESGQRYETPPKVAPLPVPPEGDWLSLAEESRPLLHQIDAQRKAAEQSAAFSRVDSRPDLHVWLGYRLRTVQTPTDEGADLVSVGVGAPIPMGSARRGEGARRSFLEDASALSESLVSARNGITADMTGVMAGWNRAWTKESTYAQKLIPGAATTLEATQADFGVGRADFASLFEAEVALLQLERARIVAAIETHIHHVRATALLGTVPPQGGE